MDPKLPTATAPAVATGKQPALTITKVVTAPAVVTQGGSLVTTRVPRTVVVVVPAPDAAQTAPQRAGNIVTVTITATGPGATDADLGTVPLTMTATHTAQGGNLVVKTYTSSVRMTQEATETAQDPGGKLQPAAAGRRAHMPAALAVVGGMLGAAAVFL